MRRLITILLALSFIHACAVPKTATRPRPDLARLSPAEYPDFTDVKDPAGLARAVGHSIEYLSTLPQSKTLDFGEALYTVPEQINSLENFREFLLSGPSARLVDEYVRGSFDVYTAGADGEAFFTGYYTPEIKASGVKDDVYRFPLYALPDDIVTADLGLFRASLKGEKVVGRVIGKSLVPYFTREEIENGALAGRGLEAVWCSDPVDIFFLQVQGSGILVYDGGGRKHANYAGANGRPYRSIGKLLIDQGRSGRDEMSLDFLKKYLKGHPEESDAVMNYNESYVFFRVEEEGPYGCLGVPVSDERTIATDKRLYPPGALAFIDTEAPLPLSDGSVGWGTYRGFVMDQDTGGAIKGPGRVDIYFGSGEQAAFRAGYMKRKGRLYFLAGKNGVISPR